MTMFNRNLNCTLSGALIVLTALSFTGLQNVRAQNAAPIDLTIMHVNAPMVPAPAGFPPFPARVDLPVYLSKDEPADDYWNTSTTSSSPDRTGLGNDSQPHAALAQSMLAARNVVPGFEELKRAVELNSWKAGDQPDQASCHRMIADILMEYALKAKDTGRGTRGMQRLLNAYIEYRQSVFLDPSNSSSKAGLVNVTKEIASIQPTFNNFLALGSANLISGNKSDAVDNYGKCIQLSQLGGASVSPEMQSEVLAQLAKLSNVQNTQPGISKAEGADQPYVHHVQADFGKTDKSVKVQENDDTIKLDPFGTSSAYLDHARRSLAKEWYLSHFQTTTFPTIAFGVDKRGNITELRIAKSSGNSQIDENALNVARRVAPFPNTQADLGEMTYTFDNKKEDVDMSDYMRQLRRKIRHIWHPPHDLQEDHVVVAFKVHKDGSVDNIVMNQPSASEPRNTACIDAVKNAAPFQHFPEGAPESEDVQFHFDHAIESK